MIGVEKYETWPSYNANRPEILLLKDGLDEDDFSLENTRNIRAIKSGPSHVVPPFPDGSAGFIIRLIDTQRLSSDHITVLDLASEGQNSAQLSRLFGMKELNFNRPGQIVRNRAVESPFPRLKYLSLTVVPSFDIHFTFGRIVAQPQLEDLELWIDNSGPESYYEELKNLLKQPKRLTFRGRFPSKNDSWIKYSLPVPRKNLMLPRLEHLRGPLRPGKAKVPNLKSFTYISPDRVWLDLDVARKAVAYCMAVGGLGGKAPVNFIESAVYE